MRGRGIEGLPKDNVSLLDNYSLVFFYKFILCVTFILLNNPFECDNVLFPHSLPHCELSLTDFIIAFGHVCESLNISEL